MTDPGGVKVYWAEFGADNISRVTVDGSAQETLPISPGPSGPGGLALDVGTGMVYWTDQDTSTIKRTDMEGVDTPETLVTGAFSGGIALDNGAEKMFWTQGSLVKSAKNDGTSQATLVSGQSCPLGIAVDAAGGKVYWTDPCFGTIKRASSVNGSGVETLVSSGLTTVGGIALDIYAGKMYWVDTGGNNIKRANLDGTAQQTIVSTGLNAPEDIAIDPIDGWVYWTEFGPSKVRASHLDGTDVQDIAPTGATPFGIDIDYLTPSVGLFDVAVDSANGYVYYSDWGTHFESGERVGRLVRTQLDGTSPLELVGKARPNPYIVGIALDVAGGKLYWTARDPDLSRANLNGTGEETLKPIPHPHFPRSVALDAVNGKLYYTDVAGDRIMQSNLDGSGEVVWHAKPNPMDVALDVAGGKVYWTETDGVDMRVMRANLNGTAEESLVSQPKPHPITPKPGPHNVSLALDVAGGKMYVTFPQPNPSGSGEIARYNLDGTGEEILLRPIPHPYNIALDIPHGKMYWTDAKGLRRANLNGTNVQILVTAAPDDDLDRCPNANEQQTLAGSETTGGRRSAANPNDYMNPSKDGLNRIDDVLMTVQAYYDDAYLDPPTNSVPNPAYNPDTDRTALGPNLWNLGPPDGLQRIPDILAMIAQYYHDCS